MVATTSAAAQASEIEKKRKQTLEKAKATHLSRQLQMRLQYARLKVEHGWQKQNLNEVENLYFHHSHQRGPKPYPMLSPILAGTHADTSSTSSPSKFSDPSYKAWLNTLSQSFVLDTPMVLSNSEITQSGGTPRTNAPTSAEPSVQAVLDPQHDTIPRLANTETASSIAPQNLTTLAQTPAQSIQVPSLQGGAARDNPESSYLASQNTVPSSSASAEPTSILSQPQSTTFPPFSGGASNMVLSTASTSKLKKPPGGHKNTSLTTKDMFNFNSTSLTYDSFWSGLQSKTYPSKEGVSATAALTGTGAGVLAKGSTGASTGALPNSTPLTMSVSGSASALNSNSTLQQQLALISTPIPSCPSPSNVSSLVPAQTPSLEPSSLLPTPFTTSSSATTLSTTTIPQPQLLEAQHRLLSDHLSAWGFSPAQHPGAPVLPQDFIPTSLLSNPAALPFFANLSASYLQALNSNGGQAHPANVGVVGVDVAGAGTTGTSSASAPTPTHAPPALSAFVGQQES